MAAARVQGQSALARHDRRQRRNWSGGEGEEDAEELAPFQS